MKRFREKRAGMLKLSIAAMFLVAIIPILCGWFFYIRSSQVIESQEQSLMQSSVQMLGQRLGNVTDEITALCVTLKYEFRKLRLPPLKELDTQQRLAIHSAAASLKNILSDTGAYVESIYLYSNQGGYALTVNGFSEKEQLFQKFYAPYGGTLSQMDEFHTVFSKGQIRSLNGNRLYYIMTVAQENDENITLQLVAILKTKQYLNIITPYLTGTTAFHLQGANGELLLSCGHIPEETVTEECSAAFGDYRLIMEIPSESARFHTQALKLQYIVLFITAILFCLALIIWLTRRTMVPVQQVFDSILENRKTGSTDNMKSLYELALEVNRVITEQARQSEEIQTMRDEAERRRLLTLLSGIETDDRANSGFIIAAFSGEKDDIDNAGKALEEERSDRYRQICTMMNGRFCMLLAKRCGEITENEGALQLERILSQLDEKGICGLYCGMSLVHQNDREIEVACREAHIACDSHTFYLDNEVIRYDAIRYHPEYFMRDWHHLDKQLRFASEIWHGNYSESKKLLKTLFPPEFLEENFSTQISELHLASLKYQFLHDINSILDEAEDENRLTGLIVRNILSCKTHAELLSQMNDFLDTLIADEKSPENEGDEGIESIRRYVREHFAEQQLCVASLAEHMKLLPNTLSKQFSRKTGMGISQYITKVRLEEAQRLLLEHPEKSVAEISSACGFGTALTFNRSFKAAFGKTPGEYRQNNG